MISVGIDPGVTGAFAVLYNGVFVCAEFLPTLQASKSKRELNVYALVKDLEKAIDFTKQRDPVAKVVFYLERVSSMPKQGVASSFTFGCAYGMIRGVLATWEHPVHLITPGKWKRVAKLTGQPKDMARTRAQYLFPQADLKFKKDVDKADALLLAHFGPECV